MSKSIRSKKKRAFRAIKRAKVFQPVEDARLKRLAKRVGSLNTEEEKDQDQDHEVTDHNAADTSDKGRRLHLENASYEDEVDFFAAFGLLNADFISSFTITKDVKKCLLVLS